MLRWLRRAAKHTTRPAGRIQLEALESRLVPSSLPVPPAQPDLGTLNPAAGAGPSGFLPTQIRHAYGFDHIRFGSVRGDGSGQTIAIIGAYDNPNLLHDLTQFDKALGLPAPPGFSKVNETGGTDYPATDSKGTWELESALDVEWVHALAPGARLVLVEAATATFDDLNAAVDTARRLPGVSVVSMSYGGGEFAGENADDAIFTTPAGHAGVTFVASTGDVAGATEYPASSPNVLAVGGTSLRLNAAGNYAGETAWSKGGGGLSPFEGQPAYQKGVVRQGIAARSTPDVAFDADPDSGVPVYDSFNNGTATPWVEMGGTSYSAPAWAALIAIADQGRAILGSAPLDGPSQTLPAIYRLPSGDLHDVAAAGYDAVTGRGSPVANLVVNYLVEVGHVATHFRVTATSASTTAGAALSVTVTALDANNRPVPGYLGTVHFSSSDARAGLPADYTFTAGDDGSHTFTLRFKTAGSQVVRVSDRASLTGTLAGLLVSPARAVTLRMSAQPVVTAGDPTRLTVEALDAYGNLASGYRGTVRFLSTDGRALLPRDYVFRASDRGEHTFNVTLKSSGIRSVSVEDLSNRTLRGSVAVTARIPSTPTRGNVKP